MTKSVSIIIRALNEAELIGETLQVINSQQHTADEVIVVDCHSSDGTPEIARDHGATVVPMHPNEFTYGGGINYGIDHAMGDYLVILSAHAVPTTESWLENLLIAVSAEDIAGAYGKQVSTEDSDPLEARSLKSTFGETPRTQTADPFFSNANSIIDRTVWESNKFDEDIPYSEDQKWAKKVQQNGYKIRYVPDAPVVHVHNETIKQVFDRNRNQGRAQQILDPTQNRSLPRTLLRTGQEVALDWVYLMKRRAAPKQFVRAPVYRAAESFGYYRGLQLDEIGESSDDSFTE